LFLFPTHGENFGHVIIESLSSGLPVLISDQTPWHDVTTYQAGFDVSNDDVEKYRQILNKFVQMNDKEYDIFRKGALNYANDYFNDSNILDQNRLLFINTIQSGNSIT
jgi:glycosyltransferase involved in cell wall biosynthesis